VSELDSLAKSFVELYNKLRDEMRQNWQRDLPVEEMLFDRWERAKSLGFGEESSIYHNSYVYGDVKVGKNTWIGPYTLLMVQEVWRLVTTAASVQASISILMIQ